MSSDTFLPVHEQYTHASGGITQSRVRLDGRGTRLLRMPAAAFGLVSLASGQLCDGSANRRANSVQQPGAGAQVRTGVASGYDTDARLANLLAEHQYARIESELPQLPPQQAQLYRGILANRNNDVKDVT